MLLLIQTQGIRTGQNNCRQAAKVVDAEHEAGAGIGEVYAALDAVLKGWADKSAARYKPAADPFSFDLQPRADLTAFYVEPAQTRPAVGYLGSAGLDVATVTIWASREARDDAGAAGLALANDLQRLRRAVCDADLGDDVLLRPTFESAVSTRREGAVSLVGRLRFEIEYEVAS